MKPPRGGTRTVRMRNNAALGPIHVDANTWLYAERKGLAVVHEHRDEIGAWLHTATMRVPWRLIQRALKVRPVTVTYDIKPKKGKRR